MSESHQEGDNHREQALAQAFRQVRAASMRFCEPLAIEDYGLQAVAETSPVKWHLAHTSWFFETFILKPLMSGYQAFDERFEYLFNSYYNGVGAQFPRAQRSLLSRPTVEQVLAYRDHVDTHMVRLLEDSTSTETPTPEQARVVQRCVLGLHHEQQHQELMHTDLKFNLACNPLFPEYRPLRGRWLEPAAAALAWHDFEGGITGIGMNESDSLFCFDNETPHHRVLLEPFQLASRLSTNAEFLAFVDAGGYQQPQWWLSDGWARVQQDNWQHPLYWHKRDGQWFEFTLYGLQPLDPSRPVSHISAYEADAFARWSDARLPTEFEWESVARQHPVTGQFLDSDHLHPRSADPANGPAQMHGALWQWTSSSYAPYPGYQPADGALGEYNGKFMCNQLVLRGGSCVSERQHVRSTYRNFFYPGDRWQFSGVRLARNGRRDA
ncbi:MAG: ergothioneine biosynthesis protein EgtB [Alcanivoracaceae bacterium]|nr:ergothioneine biosynthesis protein EgtB [Alcanivoracaceae bacterium]